jgi:serine/threonine-protein kinase
MEVIRGQSGAEILRARGRLPVDEALDLVSQSCRGLDYAHRNGVVHRDVKPGNLLRSDDGVVKLADFGIAKAVHEESSITQVGSVLGTASYLAPEQARGEEAGPAADLYALGVVTYQLLSGRLPYEANSLTELALKQQREAPAYLHELDPAIPEELSLAVDRALSLDPRERHPDAEALRRSLQDAAKGIADTTGATRAIAADTGATRVVGGPVAPVPQRERTAEHPATIAPRTPRPARSGAAPVAAPQPAAPPARRSGGARRLLVGLLILALVLAGGAAAVIASSQDERGTNLRRVTSDQVGGMVDELKQLIDDNTR